MNSSVVPAFTGGRQKTGYLLKWLLGAWPQKPPSEAATDGSEIDQSEENRDEIMAPVRVSTLENFLHPYPKRQSMCVKR